MFSGICEYRHNNFDVKRGGTINNNLCLVELVNIVIQTSMSKEAGRINDNLCLVEFVHIVVPKELIFIQVICTVCIKFMF